MWFLTGTSNKASKNIAEVSISVENANHDGPMQYKWFRSNRVLEEKLKKIKVQNFI